MEENNKNNKLFIVAIVCVLLCVPIGIILGKTIFTNKDVNNNTQNNAVVNNTIEDNNTSDNVSCDDYDNLIKKYNLKVEYEDDNYIVYEDNGLCSGQYNKTKYVYEKKQSNWLNNKYAIVHFTKIDDSYYVFYDNYSSTVVSVIAILNLSENKLYRSIPGMLKYDEKNNLYVFGSGNPVIRTRSSVWNTKLEQNDIYHSQDDMAYNNDKTITVLNGNDIYVLNSNAEIVKDKISYDEVIGIYDDFIVVKENNVYSIRDQYGKLLKELSKDEIDSNVYNAIVDEYQKNFKNNA